MHQMPTVIASVILDTDRAISLETEPGYRLGWQHAIEGHWRTRTDEPAYLLGYGRGTLEVLRFAVVRARARGR